ncbi:MFS transporter [Nonomuraea sp. NN258]|uniref:MFS transporter n=1 Tax=Nonomuraea antri TaxID=2730852 RepID=UPI0015686CEC|nr:MFS transporter [Nonomuraea antri]NRQ38565.1 MFS transporter [Nonomuraea antri]
MLELLKDRTYRRYWLSVVISFLGDAMTRVTLIFVADRLTDSPAVIAMVVFSQLLPTGVLGAFVGPLADRFPKRVLLVGSDVGRMVVVLAMIPFLDSIWTLMALIVLEGVGSAFFENARIAAVPTIVGTHRIPVAVALFQSTYQTVYLIGPALGGLLIAVGSVPVVLMIDAATFLVSALLLGSLTVLRERPDPGREHEPYWRSLRTGVRGVLAVGSLRFLFVVLIPVTLVFGLFTTNFNAQLLTVFDLPAIEYGTTQAVFAGGSILGALLGPVLIRRSGSPGGLLVAAVVLFGLAMAALGPTQWLRPDLGLSVVVLWCVLTGLGASLYEVPVANTLLRDLPEDLRGRGVGLLQAVTVNFTLIGVAAGGLLGSAAGVADSIIVAGLALVVIAVALIAPFARSGKNIRPLRQGQRGIE